MLSQKGCVASWRKIFIPVHEVLSASLTAFSRRPTALWKAFIALADWPDTRKSTPWLLRLQAYLTEFMVDDVWVSVVFRCREIALSFMNGPDHEGRRVVILSYFHHCPGCFIVSCFQLCGYIHQSSPVRRRSIRRTTKGMYMQDQKSKIRLSSKNRGFYSSRGLRLAWYNKGVDSLVVDCRHTYLIECTVVDEVVWSVSNCFLMKRNCVKIIVI